MEPGRVRADSVLSFDQYSSLRDLWGSLDHFLRKEFLPTVSPGEGTLWVGGVHFKPAVQAKPAAKLDFRDIHAKLDRIIDQLETR